MGFKSGNIANIFTITLLLGCTIFVIYRGNDCFKKFMVPPEVADISFKSNAKLPFPSLTFCPDPHNMFEYAKERYPKTYSIEALTKCNITLTEYFNERKWSSENCPDPRALYNEAVQSSSLEKFHFKRVVISTTDNGTIVLDALDPKLSWKPFPFIEYGLCHTLKMSESMISLGITKIEIWTKEGRNGFFMLFIHNDGSLFTEMDYANVFTRITHLNTMIKLDYEATQLLHFDGSPCQTNMPYDLKACKMNHYHKKNVDNLGCTVPDQFEYKICVNETDKKLARQTLSERILKQCPSPCNFLKISMGGETTAGARDGMVLIQIFINAYIKVIHTKTSYSGLELLAEVGGYVGLFLGVSVFHLSEVFKKVLQLMKWH